MDWMKELHIAAENNQKVTLKLPSGETISGVAEVSNDADRAKVRTLEGPVWIPYNDIDKVSRVIAMLKK